MRAAWFDFSDGFDLQDVSRSPTGAQLATALTASGITLEHVPSDRLDRAWVHEVARHRYRVLHLNWLTPFYQHARQTLRSGVGPIDRLAAALMGARRFLDGLRAARAAGLRIVWTLHNLFPHERHYPWLDAPMRKRVRSLAHAMIVPCRCALAEVTARFGRPNEAWHIPGGDLRALYPDHVSRRDARAALGLGDAGHTYVFFGKLREYKGLTTLVHTFRALPDPTLRLVIAGEPADARSLVTLHQAIAGDRRVRVYPGNIPSDSVQVFMRAADSVVLPFTSVLNSATALLALGFGKPVVAPRLGCLPEIVGAGPASILYAPGDLGAALVDAQREDPLRERDALARADAHDWSRVAQLTAECYRGAPSAGRLA